MNPAGIAANLPASLTPKEVRARKFHVFKPAASFHHPARRMAAKPKPKHNYDESKIKTLSSLEHIRLRTGMYIGRIGNGDALR